MSDRKYRHRGYQDNDRDSEPRSRLGPKPERREGPRGRSVGLDANAVFKCNRCATVVLSLEDFTPESTCSKCGSELHTCMHCADYDPQAPFECRAGVSERVTRKQRKNDCELFRPKVVLDLTGKKPETPGDARSAFDKLFGK